MKYRRLRILLLFAVLVCFIGASPEESLKYKTQAAPEIDALFQQREGWIGADGAYSVPLSPQKTVWLFSDTWVGKVRDGKRVDAKIVNNTLAIQDGKRGNPTIKFFVRRDENGKPAAFIIPADGHGWFWLQAGARLEEKLYLFLAQIERTKDPGVFGFRQVGQWLGEVANPDADPLDWKIEQHKLPSVVFSPERNINFGSAVFENGEFLYVYGIDEDLVPRPMRRYLLVARVPKDRVAQFSEWRFFHDGKWAADFQSASRQSEGVASESSVSYLPKLKRYVLVYSEAGLSPNILVRTAPAPVGPWTEPITVYKCPETAWDKRIFCYAAKDHPELAGDNQLLISYAANSFELSHVVSDARLYWPRFIRVTIGDE